MWRRFEDACSRVTDRRTVPRWGMMNVGEMVCHLREAYRGAMNDVHVAMQPSPLPRGVMKRIALHRVPLKWPKSD